MNRPNLVTGLVLLVSLLALIAGLVKIAVVKPAEPEQELPGFMSDWMPGRGAREGIAVVDVSGVIQFGTEDIGPFSSFQPTIEGLAERVRKLRRDDKVKAIVLRVNSPGGSLAASQALYEEIRITAREASKPVVVSMGDMAASGGYYISAPATYIFAYPGTITASIGVIVAGLNLKGLMERYGVKMQSFTSGKNKDSLAYWRDARPDEIELMNTMVAEAYEQFLQVVIEHRGIPREELEPYADGRILLGSQAKELKLVDELGGFRAALRKAAELSGLDTEDPPIVHGRPELLERLNFSFGGWLSGLLRPGASWPAQGPLVGARQTAWPVAYLYQAPLVQLPLTQVRP